MTSTDLDPKTPATRRRWWILGSVAAAVLVIGAGVVVALVLSARSSPHTYRYVVPAGTAARAAKGEVVQILPVELNVHVGDRIIIRNDDTADFNVGPYTVRGGETLEQTFRRPGAITGECGLTPSNEIQIFIT
jgi:hypothetical protein